MDYFFQVNLIKSFNFFKRHHIIRELLNNNNNMLQLSEVTMKRIYIYYIKLRRDWFIYAIFFSRLFIKIRFWLMKFAFFIYDWMKKFMIFSGLKLTEFVILYFILTAIKGTAAWKIHIICRIWSVNR